MDIKPLIAAFVREITRFLGADPALVRATVNLADALTNDVTPGGPMPEPWPGMGVETVDGGRIDRWIPDLARVNGVWYLLPHGALAEDDDIENEYLRLDDATAIYDGRRRIWFRNP